MAVDTRAEEFQQERIFKKKMTLDTDCKITKFMFVIAHMSIKLPCCSQ